MVASAAALLECVDHGGHDARTASGWPMAIAPAVDAGLGQVRPGVMSPREDDGLAATPCGIRRSGNVVARPGRWARELAGPVGSQTQRCASIRAATAFCASLVASGGAANISAIIIATGVLHSSMPNATGCSPSVSVFKRAINFASAAPRRFICRLSSPTRNCLVEMRISKPAMAFGLANASHVARTKSSVSVTCAGSDNTSSDAVRRSTASAITAVSRPSRSPK